MIEKREGIWLEIRKQRQFTLNSLLEIINLRKDSIRSYLIGLTNAGYLQVYAETPMASPMLSAEKHYRLIKDCGVIAPRVREDGSEVTQGKSRQQIWATLRVLKIFTAKDLAIKASTEEVPVACSEAKNYCSYLQKAGYLRIHRKGRGSIPTIYASVPSRYSGPRPPMIQRIDAVFDANLGKVVWNKLEGRHDQK